MRSSFFRTVLVVILSSTPLFASADAEQTTEKVVRRSSPLEAIIKINTDAPRCQACHEDNISYTEGECFNNVSFLNRTPTTEDGTPDVGECQTAVPITATELRIPIEFDHFDFKWKADSPKVDNVQVLLDAVAEWGKLRVEQMLKHTSPTVLHGLLYEKPKVRLVSFERWDYGESALGTFTENGGFLGVNLNEVLGGRLRNGRSNTVSVRIGTHGAKELHFDHFEGTALRRGFLSHVAEWTLGVKALASAEPNMHSLLNAVGGKNWRTALFAALDKHTLGTLVHEVGHLVHLVGMKDTEMWTRFEKYVGEYKKKSASSERPVFLATKQHYATLSEDPKHAAHKHWYEEARTNFRRTQVRALMHGGSYEISKGPQLLFQEQPPPEQPYIFYNKFELWAVLTEAWFNSGCTDRRHNAGVFSRALVQLMFPGMGRLLQVVYGGEEDFWIRGGEKELQEYC